MDTMDRDHVRRAGTGRGRLDDHPRGRGRPLPGPTPYGLGARNSDNELQEVIVIMAKDPVCGMEIDPAKAAGSVEYEGQTYYFCSPSCQQAFQADPAKHAAN